MENRIMKSMTMFTIALAIIAFLIALLLMSPNAQGINDVLSIWSEVFFGISLVSFIAFIITYFKASRGDQ
ncbi:MAG: hypothetical protein ACP5UV_02380 [Thermoplasmata archaeon]